MGKCVMVVAKAPNEYKMGTQHGDIVDIVPADHKFNDNELARYIIVPIADMKSEDYCRLVSPQYDDGLDIPVTERKGVAKMVAKRKYKVDFSDLEKVAKAASVAWNTQSAYDPTVKYQPFTDAKIADVSIKTAQLITDKVTNTYASF